MAPKKKGKGKSKSDDGGGADGDGKKKNAPPTEVEREEMRLKITALEQKLASATARLEAQDAQATEGVALLAQKEKDHKDVMDFIKKELEKRERENASLEKKYILLREAKECGCAQASGLDMFVGQAARQFSLFTGEEPALDLMRAAVLDSM